MSRIKMQADLGLGEGSLPGVEVTAFLLCPHRVGTGREPCSPPPL